MMQKTVVCLILLAVFSFSLACGCLSPPPAGDSGKGNPPATDAEIRVITEEFPPFSYATPGGNVSGQSTDVVNAILARLNQKATITVLPWSEGYARAIAGPKTAIYSTGRTDEREQLFKWVGPIASFDYMLYARNGSGLQINSLEAAKTAGPIGVVKDDARHQFLLQNRFSNIATCDSDAGCLRDLIAGKTVFWLGTTANAAAVAKSEGISTTAFEGVYPVRAIEMYIAFSNDTPDNVITAWQDALDAMKRDGTFNSIRRQYGFDIPVVAEAPASAGEQAGTALSAMIAETDSRLKIILRTFEVMTITSEVQSRDWEQIRPLLATLESHEPTARTWYANPDGSYYTIVDNLTSANLKSRTYFPVVLGGSESVGTVVVSLSTGKNTAIVAVPVMEENRVTGVLGASVYLDTLTEMLRQEIPEPFAFYAVDREGKFALHSEKGEISRNISTIGAGSSFGQALGRIQAQEAGTEAYDDGGVHYLARYRTSPLTGWKFVVAWPEAAGTPA